MELGRMNWEIFRYKIRSFEEQQNELGMLSLRNGVYRKGSVVASNCLKAGMSICSVWLSHQIGMDDLGFQGQWLKPRGISCS